MAVYTYKAINEKGSAVSGQIEADSKFQAMESVSSMGYIPDSVKKKAQAQDSRLSKKVENLINPVKANQMILYTMQIKTLIQAGVPIIQVFQILGQQSENPRLKSAADDMKEQISKGSSLYDVFLQHKNIFSNLYCSLIKAGEVSGALPNVLERLIYILEHEDKVKSDIMSAVRYPIIVVVFLIAAFFVLLMFVVPQFVSIFQTAGIELPLPTRICIIMYSLINNYWPYMLVISAGSVFGLFQFIKTEKGRLMKDRFLMKLPLIGELLKKSAMSRFASIFSILQSSGISILDSLETLSNTINNTAVIKEFEKIKDLLVEGRGISMPLKNARYFPPMVVNMVAVGEESGNLDEMLTEIAKHYDIEVEYATKKFSDALGPVLVVGLSVVVGFFAFAIFLPMWDLTKMVN